MDRTTATYYPDSTYVSNYYNDAGFPTSVRDRMGRWTQNTYDDAGHLTRVDYPNGDWVKKLYKGNLVSMLIDGAANTTEYFYCHEQLTGVKFPDGSTRAAGFDNLNRQIWAVDERGVVVTNAYDKLDRVIASVYVPYDGNNLPTSRTVTPLPNGLTIPTCDTSIIHGDFTDQNINYAYDKVGNVTNMTDWVCTITNAYDSLNRKIMEYTKNNDNQNIEYAFYPEYDLLDNRTNLKYYSDDNSFTHSYTYDKLNRLASLNYTTYIDPIFVTNIYNPNGKISSITATENGNDRTERNFSYDSEQRLNSLSGKYNGNTKLSLSYTYNNAQQIVSSVENIAGENHGYTYNYDNRDQIINEFSLETQNIIIKYSTGYTYDSAQNRLSKGTGDTYSYVYANKLTNIYVGSQSANNKYFYDFAGNLITNIKDGIISEFFYNAQNKLAKITGANFVYEFLYDSQNRRIGIAKGPNENSLTWRYTIHDGNVPIGETDSSGEVNRWFVRGVGIAEGTGDMLAEIIGYDNSAKATFYLSNHRGDTMMVYRDNNGTDTLVAKYRYDAFGNQRSSYCVVNDTTHAPRFTFSTKEYLSDAELYLYAYRVYDPISGRWTQRDPIDYQDSINLYQFCGNNPVNKTDADGQRDGGNYFTHCDPDYSYNWKTENRFNSEAAYDGASMFAPEAIVTMAAAAAVVVGTISAGPAIVAVGAGVINDVAYVGVGLIGMAVTKYGPSVTTFAMANADKVTWLLQQSIDPSSPGLISEGVPFCRDNYNKVKEKLNKKGNEKNKNKENN